MRLATLNIIADTKFESVWFYIKIVVFLLKILHSEFSFATKKFKLYTLATLKKKLVFTNYIIPQERGMC
jgi:hypothetical protein